MKRLMFLVCLICCSFCSAQIDLSTASDSIAIIGTHFDAAGGTVVAAASGDSVWIKVAYMDGGTTATVFNALYDTSDPELSVTNDRLLFGTTFETIDGAGGDGRYIVNAVFFDESLELATKVDVFVTVGVVATLAEVNTELNIDSLLAMNIRQCVAAFVPCDSSFTLELPTGEKPKVTIEVYCISDAGGGNADTTLVGTMTADITNSSSSTTNVLENISFKIE